MWSSVGNQIRKLVHNSLSSCKFKELFFDKAPFLFQRVKVLEHFHGDVEDCKAFMNCAC